MAKNNGRIVVVSGKGGTGKTFTAVNLACVASDALYADMDVEEPNGDIFLKPIWQEKKDITVMVPSFNADRCTACRQCVDFCRFNALSFVGNRVLVFKDICHGCGGCVLVCPTQSMREDKKTIGHVQSGTADSLSVLSGRLNPGQPSGVPIISAMHKMIASSGKTAIIDGPPGAACTVMEAVKDADYVVLVAEPTAFGVHNMAMLKTLIQLYQKPFGVVINKQISTDNPIEPYCQDNHIPVLARIPFDKTLAETIASGKIAVKESLAYRELFLHLYETILEEMTNETVTGA